MLRFNQNCGTGFIPYVKMVFPFLSSPRVKRAGPKGLPAESTMVVTCRRCPHSGVGKDFLWRRPFFYEKGHNLETKSRQNNPKVPNRPSHRGLQTDYIDEVRGNKQIFGPESEFLGLLFELSALQGGRRGPFRCPGPFWAQNWPKNLIFYASPI